MTELPNHEIGLMFEKFDSWSRNELHMKNVVPYITFKIVEIIIEIRDGLIKEINIVDYMSYFWSWIFWR